MENFSKYWLVESLDFSSYSKQERNFALPDMAQRPCRMQVWKVKLTNATSGAAHNCLRSHDKTSNIYAQVQCVLYALNSSQVNICPACDHILTQNLKLMTRYEQMFPGEKESEELLSMFT